MQKHTYTHAHTYRYKRKHTHQQLLRRPAFRTTNVCKQATTQTASPSLSKRSGKKPRKKEFRRGKKNNKKTKNKQTKNKQTKRIRNDLLAANLTHYFLLDQISKPFRPQVIRFS